MHPFKKFQIKCTKCGSTDIDLDETYAYIVEIKCNNCGETEEVERDTF